MDLKKNLSVAVIAGGKSVRFGEAKTEAIFNGKRLIDIALSTAKEISDSVSVILGDKQLDLDGIPAYKDMVTGQGPLGGILTALNYADTPWIAIIPTDMPLLSAKVFDTLCKSACNDDNKPIVALSEKGLEPLVSIWPRTALAPLREYLQNGGRRIWRFLKLIDAVYVDLPNLMDGFQQKQFYNINTKEDLELLLNEKSILPNNP